MKAYKKYQKKYEYSYTLGIFPTIELIKKKPEHVIQIVIHERMEDMESKEQIIHLCNTFDIPLLISSKQVESLRDKENCLVVGIFRKYSCKIAQEEHHIVLVNPGDLGNMGSIMRTCLGFQMKHIVIIEPSVDVFHPKVIRASMGAVFQVDFAFYQSFETYYNEIMNREHLYGRDREVSSFMLQGAVPLQNFQFGESKKRFHTLVFGNEASGLPDEFLQYGSSIYIQHSDDIDSLNLSNALGIGVYEFRKQIKS